MSNDLKRTVEALKKEIENLRSDNHFLQGRVTELELKLEMKETEVDAVTSDLAEIAEYVQDLETALAEAYLTDTEKEPTSH